MQLKSKLFYSYLILLLIYCAFTLIPNPSAEILKRYHVSALGLRLIDLTLIIIIALIWFAAFYGYAKLHRYYQFIKHDKDGKQVGLICEGIFYLMLWLPISSVVSSIFNYINTRHPNLIGTTTIINNYIGLIFPLIGFVLIGIGARRLNELVKKRPSTFISNILSLIIVYVAFIYFHLIASTQNRDVAYHMSFWPLMLTLAVPYSYMWFTGLVAAYELYYYQQKVVGIIYKKSWKYLALGIGWLIISSMALQYLTTISSRLDSLSIYIILAIVYALLILIATGFLLVMLGAKKLQKIEEA